MMWPDLSQVAVYVRPGHTDMRKQVNGLAIIAEEQMELDPLSGAVLMFCNRQRRILKALYWDGTGFALWMKKLETDRLPWPQSERAAREITAEQLTAEAREELDEDVLAYINTLESRNEQLLEELRIALYRKFGRSSEIDRNEPQLFDESETESSDANETAESEDDETVAVAAHTKEKPRREPIDDSLPRVEIRHDIDDPEKHCGCGSEMVCIGEETSERLQVIPEQVWVERHVRPKYACHSCEGSGDEEKPAVRIAAAAPSLMPGSIATAGLLAFIIVNKFCDHMPFYRQQQCFERIGVHISRCGNGRLGDDSRKATFTADRAHRKTDPRRPANPHG